MTKKFDDGQILEYEYLWDWQAQAGRRNGEKDRPVCLAMVIKDEQQGITHLIILPISGARPVLIRTPWSSRPWSCAERVCRTSNLAG
ncbi:hypothetical protein PYH37_002096 [Sinorhizobium numidicum]|uniref:Uncharacterized protein n=1 Tax=Sinorhizobium numidicum TaxID=680248 RepID=A0ABY8CR30_9HYPH|nr:hypothetical protein [Sinorhizobium numidicum]WEX74641.1 hypothetical protein PYH37_002096 [Sinorhizobium numidicum]WEX80632.1 hypothetical protein PYH38_002098 [Sinorhizobium numidicum]